MAIGLASLTAVMLSLTGCSSTEKRDSGNAKSGCSDVVFEGDQFTVCRFDPAHQTIELALNDKSGTPLRSFAKLKNDLGARSKRVAFAMNAGMFDDAGQPIGLYIQDSGLRRSLNQRDGPGNFHMKPNGVFWVDATGPHISTTDRFAGSTVAKPIYATQSGPMLVIGGAFNPQFTADGVSRNIRNGVGISVNSETIFVISATPVSFGKFARVFRDALKCPDALYFDGAISSLWDPAADRMDDSFAIGPMVVVMQRTAK